jgi:hypothetical protein
MRVHATLPRAACRLTAAAAALCASLALAQGDRPPSVVWVQAQAAADPIVSASPTTPAPDLRLANALVIGGGVAGVAAYGFAKWWDEGFTGSFHSDNEGWFGQDTPNGGADKLGHAYTANAGVRLVSAIMQSYGNDRGRAADLAFWSTLGTLTAVEIADGFSKQYAFSWQDAVMNVLGAGFGYWQEKDPAVDALLDFRLMYQQSSDSSSWDPAGDYSGQTYLLVAKASGVPALRDVPVLRYLEIAVGYGTRGYEGPSGPGDRSRFVYYGLQINLGALLDDTLFAGSRWPAARRASEVFFDLWQVPNTGVYDKSRL